MQSEIQLSLVVLVTGLVIVFAVLIGLVLIVRGYGAAIRSLQNRTEPKASDRSEPEKAVSASPAQTFIPAAETTAAPEGAIPGEVVAAIAAAVTCMFPSGKVTSIRRSAASGRSAWGMAGLMEGTHPF
jgi:sodium pump decarboxylase gamma subunit